MGKDDKTLAFLGARETVFENLEALRSSLDWCVHEGLRDDENLLYNELLALIDEAGVMKTWEELERLVTEAKTLEKDIATWHSRQGRTSLSFPWPKRPS